MKRRDLEKRLRDLEYTARAILREASGGH